MIHKLFLKKNFIAPQREHSDCFGLLAQLETHYAPILADFHFEYKSGYNYILINMALFAMRMVLSQISRSTSFNENFPYSENDEIKVSI